MPDRVSRFILYNAPQSTCSQRVRFVLNAKALAFEEKKLDLLAGDQLKPEYLALNPNGVVPTLDHEGAIVIAHGRPGPRAGLAGPAARAALVRRHPRAPGVRAYLLSRLAPHGAVPAFKARQHIAIKRHALGFLAALWTAQLHAALPDEIQVYTDDLEAPGKHGLELHVNTTPKGRAAPGYPGEVTPHHGVRMTPELSLGLAPGWDAGVYLPFVRSAERTEYFAGPRFRLKWIPVKPAAGSAGYFAGINWELSFVEPRFEEARRTVETRPILGYRNDDWLLSFNPIIDTDLAGAQKGVLTFAPAFKVARNVAGHNALGLEYYAELGRLSHFAPRGEQSHVLYFVLDTPSVNFGIGRGLGGAADRWTLKTIFSF